MSLFCSKSRVLLSTLTPPGWANSHFPLSCCSYVTAMTWFHADMERNDRQSKSSDAAGLLSSSHSGWWWSSELWFVTSVTFYLSLSLSASDMCIASAISLLMILICGMATYGAYKVNECVGSSPSLQTAPLSWKCVCVLAACCLDHPFFLLPNIWLCSQHPGGRQHRGLPQHHPGLPAAAGRNGSFLWPQRGYFFAANSILPSFFPWQPDNFPYKDEIAALSNVCLVLLVLLFISCILGFKVALSYSNRFVLLLVVSDPSGQHGNSCEFHSRCSCSFRQADVGTWMHHQKQHSHELPYHFI